MWEKKTVEVCIIYMSKTNKTPNFVMKNICHKIVFVKGSPAKDDKG